MVGFEEVDFKGIATVVIFLVNENRNSIVRLLRIGKEIERRDLLWVVSFLFD